MIDVAIIGGGASGFYCAARLKERLPHLSVAIFEKTGKTLSKVRVSGGGRCNVTHDCRKTSVLASNYPRGGKALKKIFQTYGVDHFLNWLISHGIQTKVEGDGRIFPITDSSETIAGLFEKLANYHNIQIYRHHEWKGFSKIDQDFQLDFIDKTNSTNVLFRSKNLVIACGGIPNLDNISWKSQFNWVHPVPSLFTFNACRNDLFKLKPLSGISVSNCKVKIMGEKESYLGPILITHWGLSGPAILKTSAWMARRLSDMHYNFIVLISWLGEKSEDEVRDLIYQEIKLNSKKLWKNLTSLDLPNRLWELILIESEIDANTVCGDSNKKQINKLTENLLRFTIEISGKTTYKDEFVTAGGISLDSVDLSNMQIKNQDGIYACGEVLDIDGITGGFNFQAAWSTAELISCSISSKY